MELFIVNDAIFTKLCVLGDDVEPCFEGASVTSPEVCAEFELNKDSKKLAKPFVFFANKNWRIRIKHNDSIKECRYKKYDLENDVFEFMYIKKLK